MPTLSPLRFINECLIGSGQVMLQRSAGAGALFLAAIACGARTSMAIAAAVALLLCSALPTLTLPFCLSTFVFSLKLKS